MCDPDAAETYPWQLSALPILVRVRMWRREEGPAPPPAISL